MYSVSYNRGQKKMRNRSTPPPNSMMYSHYNENAPFFPSLKRGRGGLNFSSILSKIVRKGSSRQDRGAIIKSSFFNTFIVI